MRFTFATQNLGDTGTPPNAQIVCTQESTPARVKQALPRHTVFTPPTKRDMSIAWFGVANTDQGSIRLHRSGRAMGVPNFTPRRSALWATYDLNGGTRLLVINLHLINAGWAPAKANVPRQWLRRRLWRKSMRIVRRKLIRPYRRLGYEIILAGDLNRLGDGYTFLDHEARVGRGRLDRVFYTDGLTEVHTALIPKTGTGRVTHNGLRVTFETAS